MMMMIATGVRQVGSQRGPGPASGRRERKTPMGPGPRADKGAETGIVAGILAKPRDEKTVQNVLRWDQPRGTQTIMCGSGKGNRQGNPRKEIRRTRGEAKGIRKRSRRRNPEERVKNPGEGRAAKKGSRVVRPARATKTTR